MSKGRKEESKGKPGKKRGIKKKHGGNEHGSFMKKGT